MSRRSGERRKPKGKLKPTADEWAWLDARVGKFDDDFIAAVNEEVPQQERPELDRFFNSLPEHGDEG